MAGIEAKYVNDQSDHAPENLTNKVEAPQDFKKKADLEVQSISDNMQHMQKLGMDADKQKVQEAGKKIMDQRLNALKDLEVDTNNSLKGDLRIIHGAVPEYVEAASNLSDALEGGVQMAARAKNYLQKHHTEFDEISKAKFA